MTTSIRCGLALLVCVFLMPIAAAAQTPLVVGPGTVLAWEVSTPDIATARALVIAATVDAAAPVTLTPITCGPGPNGAAGVFTCSSPIAQIPTGSHALTLTATLSGVSSLPSSTFAYVDFLIPIPQNVRGK